MLLVHTLRQQIGLVFILLATGFVVWRGGRPERISAIAMLAAWLGCPYLVQTSDWFDPQWLLFAVDILLFGMLLWFALRTDRYWPMWAAAFQGLGVIMHVTMLADPRIVPRAYMSAAGMWSYLVVLAVVAGAALEIRKIRPPTQAAA